MTVENYLRTPPTTPDLKQQLQLQLQQDLYHQQLLDQIHEQLVFVQSPHMPNPSKIKQEPFTWEQTKFIINLNNLQVLARSKQETLRYIEFKRKLKEEQGSNILEYLTHHELNWDPLVDLKGETQIIFENPRDIKILYNKFPYYFESDVLHLCVWSKNQMEVDISNEDGDITLEMKCLIEEYIDWTFIKGLNIERQDILWFKNWGTLQSVKDISHVHILIKDRSGEIKKRVDSELIGKSGVMFQK